MTVTIRTMKDEDIQAVRKVAMDSWHNTYEKIIPRNIQDDFLNMAYNENMLKKRKENSYFYIAEKDNKVVGFANFSQLKTDNVVELVAIYLAESEKNNGIGTALLDHGIAEINPEKIYVSVEKLNEAGLAFYKAKNFVEESEYDDNFNGHILKTTRLFLEV